MCIQMRVGGTYVYTISSAIMWHAFLQITMLCLGNKNHRALPSSSVTNWYRQTVPRKNSSIVLPMIIDYKYIITTVSKTHCTLKKKFWGLLWKWALEKLLLLSYYKIVEWGWFEIERKVVTLGVHGYGSLFWAPNMAVKSSRMALNLGADVYLWFIGPVTHVLIVDILSY